MFKRVIAFCLTAMYFIMLSAVNVSMASNGSLACEEDDIIKIWNVIFYYQDHRYVNSGNTVFGE